MGRSGGQFENRSSYMALAGAHPMRWILSIAVIVSPFVARADVVHAGLTGNDTGGIIQWTPETDLIYYEIAAAHCARWSRFASITSVHRTYGDYIGFQCIIDRRYDPRRAWQYSTIKY